MTKVKIDQELLDQLEQAKANNTEVQAVFALNPPDPDQKLIAPEQAEEMVDRIIGRIQQETAEAPRDVNVFKNLGSFVIAASPAFIGKVMEQEEIASALANRRSESMFIPPRRKRNSASRQTKSTTKE